MTPASTVAGARIADGAPAATRRPQQPAHRDGRDLPSENLDRP